MTTEQLNFFGAWASILSLGVSIVSLLLIGSVKRHIVQYKRKQRMQELLDELMALPEDSDAARGTIRYKLKALNRTIHILPWSFWTVRGRTALELREQIKDENIPALKEALRDWRSFSEAP